MLKYNIKKIHIYVEILNLPPRPTILICLWVWGVGVGAGVGVRERERVTGSMHT